MDNNKHNPIVIALELLKELVKQIRRHNAIECAKELNRIGAFYDNDYSDFLTDILNVSGYNFRNE